MKSYKLLAEGVSTKAVRKLVERAVLEGYVLNVHPYTRARYKDSILIEDHDDIILLVGHNKCGRDPKVAQLKYVPKTIELGLHHPIAVSDGDKERLIEVSDRIYAFSVLNSDHNTDINVIDSVDKYTGAK